MTTIIEQQKADLAAASARFAERWARTLAEAKASEDGAAFFAAGFELSNMGGNCTAWKLGGDDIYVLVTDTGGGDHTLGDCHAIDPEKPDLWLVDWHDDLGNFGENAAECATVAEAVEAAARLLAEGKAWRSAH